MKGRDRIFILIGILAVAYFVNMRMYWDIYASPIRGSDFSSYYTAGLLLRGEGASALYAVGEGDSILGDATSGPWARAGLEAGISKQHYYIYPPFFALLFVPLTYLTFETALNLWLAMDLALMALFFAIYIRQRDGEISWPEIAFMGVAAFLEFLPLIWAMAIGQTSLIVLALLVGTLWAWRRDRQLIGGLLLGAAVAIKLTPALLILFFLWRGKKKLAFTSVAAFGAIQVISIIALGWEPHRVFFLEIVPQMAGGTCYFLNQSLGAFFNRLLTDGDVRQVELVGSVAARGLAMGVGVLLILISATRLRRLPGPVPMADELQFGLVVMLTLIISPISWTHHYLIALLPLLAVVGHLGRRSELSISGSMLAGLALLLIARKPHADLYLEGFWRIFNSAALAGGIILWFLSWSYLRPSEEVER